MSRVQGEMDDLNNQDSVLGYRVYVTWGAIETGQGVYDFSLLDAMLARLATAYNKPKRMVIYVWLYGQQGIKTNDGRVLPVYMQQDSAYGNSPVSGSYGWWGATTNGAPSGMYAPALYYQPVMDRLIALVQALGAHYDGNPNVEAIEFQENATIAQAASAFSPADSHYSDGAWLVQQQRLLSASVAAFPPHECDHGQLVVRPAAAGRHAHPVDGGESGRPGHGRHLGPVRHQRERHRVLVRGHSDLARGQHDGDGDGLEVEDAAHDGDRGDGTSRTLLRKIRRSLDSGGYGECPQSDLSRIPCLLDASERIGGFLRRRNRSRGREMEQSCRDDQLDAPHPHRVSRRLSLDVATPAAAATPESART